MREYWIWNGILNRCGRATNKTMTTYYADRGVTVCDEWSGSEGFERFYEHVGSAPSSEHTIDRLDNDRGYEPGNVRWATRREQHRNRTDNRMLTAFGKTMCLKDWAAEVGIKRTTLGRRIRAGWEVERALTTPPDTKHHAKGRHV